MPNCPQRGKKVGYFGSKSDFSGNYFCSNECKSKFQGKAKLEKQKDVDMKSKGMIKEVKCKCNQCGNI